MVPAPATCRAHLRCGRFRRPGLPPTTPGRRYRHPSATCSCRPCTSCDQHARWLLRHPKTRATPRHPLRTHPHRPVGVCGPPAGTAARAAETTLDCPQTATCWLLLARPFRVLTSDQSPAASRSLARHREGMVEVTEEQVQRAEDYKAQANKNFKGAAGQDRQPRAMRLCHATGVVATDIKSNSIHHRAAGRHETAPAPCCAPHHARLPPLLRCCAALVVGSRPARSGGMGHDLTQ